jgi:hypothetical protein
VTDVPRSDTVDTFENTVAPAAVVENLAGRGELRVWLDDDLDNRRAWEGWVHVTTAGQAIALIDSGRVIELSLDNDLADDELHGQGKHVVDFICEQQHLHGRLLWPRDGITLHTANPDARDQMTRAIERYASEHVRVRRTMSPSGNRQFHFTPRL